MLLLPTESVQKSTFTQNEWDSGVCASLCQCLSQISCIAKSGYIVCIFSNSVLTGLHSLLFHFVVNSFFSTQHKVAVSSSAFSLQDICNPTARRSHRLCIVASLHFILLKFYANFENIRLSH